MPNMEGAKALAGVIEEEKETLLSRYPSYRDQIEAYVFEVSTVVNKALEYGSGKSVGAKLDDICSEFESIDQLNLSDIPYEVQRYAIMVRGLIRKQIESGEILLGPIPISKTVNLVEPIAINESSQKF